MLQYSIMAVTFFIVGTLSLWILVEYLNLYYMVAQLIVIVVLSIANYFVSQHIFASRPHRA